MTQFTGGGIAVGNAGSEFGSFVYNATGNTWQTNLAMQSSKRLITLGGVTTAADVTAFGPINAIGNINAAQNIFVPDLTVSDSATFSGVTNFNDDVAFVSNVAIDGNITIDGSLTTNTINVVNGINLVNGNLTLNSMTANTMTVGAFTATGNTLSSSSSEIIIDPNPPGIGGTLTLSAQQTNNLGNLTVAGNVSGAYFTGNGSQLTGIYGNAQVNNFLPTYTGALSPSSVTTGNVSATNITAGNVTASANVRAPVLFNTSIQQIGTTISFLNSAGSQICYIDNTGTYNGGLTNTDVLDAIGYTPYDGTTNPNGYITSASLMGLGFGGTEWNDVTGSRALGTVYTNNYAYPIMVSASNGVNNGPTNISVVINGSTISNQDYDANGAYGRGTVWFIVPPGATYEVTGSASVQYWWELY